MRLSDAMSLRTGIERGMVTTVAVAAPLLVLVSLPNFASERAPGSSLTPVSLLLCALVCLSVPVALLRRGTPAHGWLQVSALAFLVLVAIEPLGVRSALPNAFTPWLVGLSCIAFSCLAVGVRSPLHAAGGSAVIIVGVVCAYAGRTAANQLIAEAFGLAALAAGLTVGVGAVRRRADTADAAQLKAKERFDDARRQVALEEERVRTDALLHDSVLTTLLVAASGRNDPDRTLLMAENALQVVSATGSGPASSGATVTFARAVAAAEREFAPLRGLVELHLDAAHGVELPARIADTLIAAMLQALGNSIKHAGPAASRIVRAAPVGEHGVRITVRDDGRGFDMAGIAPERLGVRVSILERVRLVGGTAEIRSSPGSGTTVVLEWAPAIAPERPEQLAAFA